MRIRSWVFAPLVPLLACGGGTGSNGGGNCPAVPLHCLCGGDPSCVDGQWVCPANCGNDAGAGDGGTSDASGGDANGGDANGGGDGGNCVTIDPASLAESCNTDPDCTAVATGTLCSGMCGCPNTAIAQSGLASYQSAIAGIHLLACPCHAEPVRCIQHVCTVCDPNGGVCGDM